MLATTEAAIVASTFRSPPRVSVTPSALARTLNGSASPILEPTNASTALNRMFCASQPMVLNASVAPTAVPPEIIVAVFSASMMAPLSACTVRLPSLTTSLRVSVAALAPRIRLLAINALTDMGLVAFRPLAAVPVPAAAPAAVPAAEPAAVPAAEPAAAAVALPAFFAVAASCSGEALCVLPDSVALISSASVATIDVSPASTSFKRSTPDCTSPRKSLFTTTPPTAAPPPLVAMRLTSESISPASMACTSRLPPTVTDIKDPVTASLPATEGSSGPIQAKRRVLSLFVARMRLAAVAAPNVTASLEMVAEIAAPTGRSSSSSSPPAATRTSPPALTDVATSRAFTLAGCSAPSTSLPTKASAAFESRP